MLSSIAGTAAWAYSFVADGIYYNITSSTNLTVEVTYETTSYNSYSGDVVIPATVENDGKTYSVTGIGQYAFMNSTGLTSVVIPNTVTKIDNYAFLNSGLLTVEIPSSVTTIGDRPFEGTPWYNNQPDGLIYLGVIAYSYKGTMPAETDVVVADGTESIAGSAFKRCAGMRSVTLPTSLKNIGIEAFSGCTGLTEISIPEGVTTIGESAFMSCSNLTSLHIPASVKSIGRTICSYTNVASLTVDPANTSYDSRENCNAIIKTWNNELLMGCKNSFIPNSVKSLDYGAFNGVLGLTSIVIPSSVTKLGYFAFSSCEDLESIVIAADNPNYDSRDNCNAVIETASNTLIYGCKTSTIPNTVTTIGGNAFYKLQSLTSISIPESVTEIMYSAFYRCEGLTTLSVPASVTKIGSNAFFFVKKVVYAGTATGSPWGAESVVSAEETSLANFEFEESATTYFDLTGKRLAQPQRGINLVRRADGTARKIIVR